jgi:hyperosmotically inducible periplasmic protein
MKLNKVVLTCVALVAAGAFGGCSSTVSKSPDVAGSIRTSLDQSNLKDVSVSQDRDKGVVTLGGHVANDADKAQAETLAKSIAVGEVVSNQVAVLPPGAETEAKDVNSDLDKGIDKNLDAAFLENAMKDGISHSVKNGVVTLTGKVRSESRRAKAQTVASSVPNVRQVVNELQVNNQKATSSN